MVAKYCERTEKHPDKEKNDIRTCYFYDDEVIMPEPPRSLVTGRTIIGVGVDENNQVVSYVVSANNGHSYLSCFEQRKDCASGKALVTEPLARPIPIMAFITQNNIPDGLKHNLRLKAWNQDPGLPPKGRGRR